MASRSSATSTSQSLFFNDNNNVNDDADTIYENVDEVRSTLKRNDESSEVQRRCRQNSRGSSSTEDSQSGSFNNVSETEKPPKTPSKLRISNPESNRVSAGSVKYSYDEVSVNFGKPVIVGAKQTLHVARSVSADDDIFGSVTFQSPLQELSYEEKEILFSISQPPVPAPRPSKNPPKTTEEKDVCHIHGLNDLEDDYAIYENPDDVKREISTKNVSVPPVPARNNFVTGEASSKDSTLKSNHSYENVYCEIQPHSKPIVNIMDRQEQRDEPVIVHVQDEEDFPARFGARPRSKR